MTKRWSSTRSELTKTKRQASKAARRQDVVNVRDFGAIGDKVTDDSVAVQQAIDHAYGEQAQDCCLGLTPQECATVPTRHCDGSDT